MEPVDPSQRPDGRERALALVLAGGRIAIGTGTWIAPQLTFKLLGLDPPSNPQAVAVARIAGTRDLILGAWMASALGDRDRLAAPTAAVAVCDAGDAATFGLLLAAGERRAGWRGLVGAGSATLAGVALAGLLGRGG